MNETQEQDLTNRASEVRFRRDSEGGVLMESADGQQTVAGMIAAFPLSNPRGMVSLRDADGRELGILENVRELDPDSRQIVREELERSYFMPRIKDVLKIQESLNVVEWEVLTNKGPRVFQIRNIRKNVRRIGPRRFVVKDVDGNRYEIRDWMTIPPRGQKILEPYL